MKYLADCDLIVQDLHSGDLRDVKLALQALQKHKFEDEKVLILISSLMAWKGTPNKLEEIRTKEVIDAERKAKAAEAARKAALEAGDQPEEGKKEEQDVDDEEADMDGEGDPGDSSIGEFVELPPK